MHRRERHPRRWAEPATISAFRLPERRPCSRRSRLGGSPFFVDARLQTRRQFVNSNTYNAAPEFGGLISGAIVRGTLRGLPPPRPVVTAMYCLSPMANET